MEMTVLIPCMRIPSVNELYLHNSQTGEVFKNPDTVRMIDQMRTFMADHYSLKLFNWLNSMSRVHITYDFILRKSLFRRDLSNMLKCVQDTLTRYIGIDDSQVLSIKARKSENRNNTVEWVACTITDSFELETPNTTNTIVIPVQYIPSINQMYNYDPKSHLVYKEQWIHGLEGYIKNYLRKNKLKERLNFVTNGTRFKCYYDFFLKSLYEPKSAGVEKSRDVDNLIKSIEDSIFRYFGVDDKWVIELYARKHKLTNYNNEYVAFTIEKSDYDTTSFVNRKNIG